MSKRTIYKANTISNTIDEVSSPRHNRPMSDKRAFPRYVSLAQARLDHIDYTLGILRDLSITGCRLEFSVAIALEIGKTYNIVIYPEETSHIDPFEISGENRWNRAGYDAFESGFFFHSSPAGKAFERYLDYLAWRINNRSAETVPL